MFHATYLLVTKFPLCVDMSENEMLSFILALQSFEFNLYYPRPIAINFALASRISY